MPGMMCDRINRVELLGRTVYGICINRWNYLVVSITNEKEFLF